MGFLSEILDQVRATVNASGYLDGLPAPRRPRPPSLRAAVLGAPQGWAVLVERKHLSPGSEAPSLPTVPVARFIEDVTAGGATGLSCLATTPAFRGSPTEVWEVARATSMPVLFKDFVIDPIQIEAAARAGASAVLLIARLETGGFLERPLSDLAAVARSQGLEVLLEVHDVDEWRIAEECAADLYGVNVRDLDSLRMEPDVAEETFRAAGNRHPLLGLSGVSTAADARRYRSWGADGILVGTGFARASEPVAFLRSLRAASRG